MKRIALTVMLLVGCLCPTIAADTGVFKLSLWNRASFTLPAHMNEIKGVDLGIGSHTGKVTGLQADLMWAQTEQFTGLSWSWGISTTGYARGVQWAFVNMANTLAGVQLAGVNMGAEITGVQLGGVNMSSRAVNGLQAGFYNQAEYIHGIQFGLLNYAKYIEGLQIGIFNIAENGFLPAMIFVNGRF